MIDFYLLIALLLLIIGIAGSIVPGLPGPVFSIAGVLFYWWSTGYQEPTLIALIIILGTAVLAFVLDYLASFVGAEKGGADKKTGLAAALAAGLLFLVTGPLGIILGTGLVVFLREILLGKTFERAFKSSFYTTVALLGSTISKVILTTITLALFLVSLFI